MELTDDLLDVLRELVRCVRSMGPYREDVVIAGGLVPLLYRFESRFESPRQEPLLTDDLDFTVSDALPIREEGPLVELLEQGGFVALPSRTVGADAPPKHFIQHERHGKEELYRIHGEFLVPLKGSELDREDKPKSPCKLQDGLNAEALRYLDLLLWEPEEIDLAEVEQLKLTEPLTARLPRPATYAIQKALASERRDDDDKADKDLACIYDVATMTHGNWDLVAEDVERVRAENATWDKWVDSAVAILEEAFGDENADGPYRVEQKYASIDVQSETVAQVMAQFIEDVFW